MYFPPNFDSSTGYPLLINLHDGPFTQYGDFVYDKAQHEALAGYVGIMANPRGESGHHHELPSLAEQSRPVPGEVSQRRFGVERGA